MTVLLIILAVIAGLIGILSIPFHVYTEYKESFVLYVRYLFIKIYIYPPENKKKKKKKDKKEKPKEEKPEEEKPAEDKPKEKGDNFIKTFYKNQGIAGVIELIQSIAYKLKKGLHGMGRSFYIRKLWLRINVADSDSANTAVKYGKVCAGVYPSLGYILDTVHSKKCSIKINPDFLGSKSQAAFDLHLFIVPSKLIGSVIKMGISLGIELIKMLISNSKSSKKAVVSTAAKTVAVSQDNMKPTAENKTENTTNQKQ